VRNSENGGNGNQATEQQGKAEIMINPSGKSRNKKKLLHTRN
jgi:hypothetical protein